MAPLLRAADKFKPFKHGLKKIDILAIFLRKTQNKLYFHQCKENSATMPLMVVGKTSKIMESNSKYKLSALSRHPVCLGKTGQIKENFENVRKVRKK